MFKKINSQSEPYGCIICITAPYTPIYSKVMFFKRKEPQFVLKVKQNRNEVFIIDELRIEAGDIETLVMQLEQALVSIDSKLKDMNGA